MAIFILFTGLIRVSKLLKHATRVLLSEIRSKLQCLRFLATNTTYISFIFECLRKVLVWGPFASSGNGYLIKLPGLYPPLTLFIIDVEL